MKPSARAFACACLLLVGCSTPPHELAQTGEFKVFSVAAPPDVLYRLVTKGVRQCYPTQQIDSEYFPDNRTARVAMSSNTGINIVAVMVADIEPAQPGSSVRVAYVRGGASFAEGVERWSRGDYTSCPFML